MAITQGGRGIVDGNIIRDSGSYGVGASQLSSAVIVNNTIQNHFQAGIGVAETAYAFVGFVLSSDAVASPNLISGNRAQGIAVFRGSYARIIGNVITDNGANGVNVRESSSAQISDNTIEGNGGNGILVNQGSGVLLGTDSGNTIFTRPNKTTRNNGSTNPLPGRSQCRWSAWYAEWPSRSRALCGGLRAQPDPMIRRRLRQPRL